jgi:Domain of unknown function (DUF4465)/Secretion system C-terminal sorting domain
MKKYIIAMAISVAGLHGAKAQEVRQGFETITLDSGEVINGSKGETSFDIWGAVPGYLLKMPIQYDTSWGGYWSGGWAISRKIDGSTGPSDFSKHLYCAKPGYGAEPFYQGQHYGKTFAVGMNGAYWLQKSVANEGVLSFYVTNSTYAYNSMKNGDNFAKKFGGASGNDADSFVLNIKFFVDTQWVANKKVVLADYRFSDNSKDYILDSWQIVNPPTYFPEGFVDSISFELESSDNGQFGMNTPGFFCVDWIVCGHWLGVKNQAMTTAQIFPNPAKDMLKMQCGSPISAVEVVNSLGQSMNVKNVSGLGAQTVNLNVANLANGAYWIKAQTQKGVISTPFVKQ